MQQMLTTDKHEFRELNVAADKAGAMMRMAVKKMADAEIQNGQ
jgi:hypothetical protein